MRTSLKSTARTTVVTVAVLLGGVASLTPGGSVAEASPAYPVVKVFLQPDGSPIVLRLWGDEFANGWEMASSGHTVIKNPENGGRWEYAVRDRSGQLMPSGIAPGAGPPPAAARLRPSPEHVNSVRESRAAPARAAAVAGVAPPWAGLGTRVLFIMVQFTDRACTFSVAQMQANLFGNTASGPGNLADYYREISYGQLQLQGTVVGNNAGQCATLSNTHAFYDTGAGSAAGLVAEAVALVDGNVDFSQFDNDNDGTVDALGIIYAGGGPHDGCDTDDGTGGSSGDNLWPHSSGTGGTATGDGVQVNPYIINSEVTFGVNPMTGCTQIQTIGLFAHEFGHSLGLPDLYDTDNSSPGVGRWSAMASQYSSTVNLADTPAHFDPWSKWFLGWITPTDYTGQNVGISLDQVEDNGQVAQFLANPGGAEVGGTGEYFLVENRQLVGFDAALPGCGILVWHLDDAQTNNTAEGHTAGSHRLVDIENADGSDDNANPDTAGTPFPGSSNNTRFDDTTTPTARLYSGAPSGVRILVPDIPCAATMPVNFGNPAADLRISKSDHPDPVMAGNQLTYTLTVVNEGPGIASNVVVTDVLPAGVQFLSDSDSCVNNSGTLTCSLGTLLDNDSATFTIQVLVPANFLSSIPASTANITNTASVDSDQPDGNLSDNSVSISTNIIDLADLRLSKECKPDQPNRQPAGTPTFCEIYVDNTGPSDARNVVITDRIISSTPITIQSISSTTTSGGAAVCPATPIGPASSFTITCTDGVLPAGARDTIRITFVADAAGDVDDTATVSAATPDPNPDNNSAVGRVSFGSSADLSLTKSAAASVIAGTNLTYTLMVTNNGPSPATSVVLRDSLPANVAFQSATVSQGACQAGVVPGDPAKPLLCNLGTLANGASATVTVIVTVNSNVPAGTVLVNNADVSSAAADPNNGDNVRTATTTVNTSADLAIVKTSDASVYKPSTQVTYQISVTNNGPSKALDVVVTDNLPDLKAALYQSDTGGCVLSAPRILTCNLGNLEVGQNKTFFVYVVIKGSKGAVSNTATVASNGLTPTPDPVAGNNSSTRVVTVGK